MKAKCPMENPVAQVVGTVVALAMVPPVVVVGKVADYLRNRKSRKAERAGRKA